MPKSRDAFRTISEVADWLETPAHVLRFWESKFTQVKPVKRAGGRRYYRPADMELLGGIKKLLHEDGMTIKGVQKVLREHGVRHVASLSALSADADADSGELIEDAPYVEVSPDDTPGTLIPFPQEAAAAAPEPEPELADPEVAVPEEEAQAEASEEAALAVEEPGPEPVDDAEAEPIPEPQSAVEEAESPRDEQIPTAAEAEPEEPESVDLDPELSQVADSPELPFEPPAPPLAATAAPDLGERETRTEAPQARPPVDLPDFNAATPAPQPRPDTGPLAQIALISALSPHHRAALEAHLPALEALRDRLSAPLS